jgi:hypothetical protein
MGTSDNDRENEYWFPAKHLMMAPNLDHALRR